MATVEALLAAKKRVDVKIDRLRAGRRGLRSQRCSRLLDNAILELGLVEHFLDRLQALTNPSERQLRAARSRASSA